MGEKTSCARESGLSRPTVMAHLEALEVAHAIYPVRPFSGGGKKEIIRRPKVYAFDTGFVSHVRGWNEIRETDRGFLWEHLVLDMLRVTAVNVFYWSDKSGSEVDFVVKGLKGEVHTFECKINPDKYSWEAISKFRNYYPKGSNFCLSPHIIENYKLSHGEIEVIFTSIPPGSVSKA